MKKEIHKEISVFRRRVNIGYKEYVITDPKVYQAFLKDDPKITFIINGRHIIGFKKI
jgi:hypothetical protein